MRKIIAALLALALSSIAALAGGIPFFPAGPVPDTAAIITALNQWIQTLNGLATPLNNNTPAVVAAGSFCTATGVSPQTCNAQRGLVTTGTLTTAAATNANFVINNSVVLASSVCEANVVSYSGTLVTNGYPVVMISGTAAGVLTVALTNVHPSNALNGAVGIGFMCYN
jgi:hypothetical protein